MPRVFAIDGLAVTARREHMDDTSTGGNTSAPAAPASFADVSWAADASPASDSTPQTDSALPAAEQPAATEVQPQSTEDARSPFIPRARFDEVNAKKAEYEAKLQGLAWAESVDRKAVEDAVRIGQLYSTDRAGYIRQVLSEAVNDPDLAPMVRSEAARLLGTRQQQAQPQINLQPRMVQLEDGSTIPLYSAEQIGALKDQWTAELDKKYEPAMRTAEEFRAAREYVAQKKQADAFASGFKADLLKLPQFAEHAAEIKERLSTMRFTTDHPSEVRAATLALYNEIVLPKLARGLTQQAQSKLLDNLQQKAAASTGINPGSAAPATHKRVDSFHQLGPDAWK